MTKFEQAVKKTFKSEGGRANDPDDSGGDTNFGVTWRVLKSWRKAHNQPWRGRKIEIDELLKEEAKKIYKVWWWDVLKADHFADFIAHELFDAGVHCGQKRSGKFLQHALNFLNLNGKLYPDLKVDGVIGSKTLNAYNILIRRSGHEVVFIFESQKGERYHYYRGIMWIKPWLEKFFRSWLRRIF